MGRGLLDGDRPPKNNGSEKFCSPDANQKTMEQSSVFILLTHLFFKKNKLQLFLILNYTLRQPEKTPEDMLCIGSWRVGKTLTLVS